MAALPRDLPLSREPHEPPSPSIPTLPTGKYYYYYNTINTKSFILDEEDVCMYEAARSRRRVGSEGSLSY